MQHIDFSTTFKNHPVSLQSIYSLQHIQVKVIVVQMIGKSGWTQMVCHEALLRMLWGQLTAAMEDH